MSAEKKDELGFVVDFTIMKKRVGRWLNDQWDHALLINTTDTDMMAFVVQQQARYYPFDGNPTVENMVEELVSVLHQMMTDMGLELQVVEIFETPNCSAKWVRP